MVHVIDNFIVWLSLTHFMMIFIYSCCQSLLYPVFNVYFFVWLIMHYPNICSVWQIQSQLVEDRFRVVHLSKDHLQIKTPEPITGLKTIWRVYLQPFYIWNIPMVWQYGNVLIINHYFWKYLPYNCCYCLLYQSPSNISTFLMFKNTCALLRLSYACWIFYLFYSKYALWRQGYSFCLATIKFLMCLWKCFPANKLVPL